MNAARSSSAQRTRWIIWSLFALALLVAPLVFSSNLGITVTDQTFGYPLWKLTISQVAPILPYLLLVLMLIFRPKGLLGTRED